MENMQGITITAITLGQQSKCPEAASLIDLMGVMTTPQVDQSILQRRMLLGKGSWS